MNDTPMAAFPFGFLIRQLEARSPKPKPSTRVNPRPPVAMRKSTQSSAVNPD